MNWHYVEQGQQAGPISDEELARLAAEGKISDETLVWHSELPNWVPYRDVRPSERPPVPSTPPPPPAPPLPGPGEVVCTECGKIFPQDETIPYGNVRVCAGCKPIFMQKLAEGAKVNMGQMNYAGFGIRLGAKILDWLILGLPFMIVYFIVAIPMMSANLRDRTAAAAFHPWILLLQFGGILLHVGFLTFFLGKYGATPGKMICKLRVVTAEGGRIGYGRALGRALSEIVSGMICYIGYFLVLFDSEKRALHDHMCSTRVVHQG